jgi:DNA replication protein DnaC
MAEGATDNIRKHLKTLKLSLMDKALEETLGLAATKNLAPAAVLERLLEIEAVALIERRIERRIRDSKLPERKLLADFDFKFQTGIDKGQIMELATLGFVERKQWLILAGSSGAGKSHLAKALLLLACQHLYRCRYVTASCMLRDLLSGLADDSLDDKLKAYLRPDILLIDEIGFDRLEQESSRNASLFFKVIEGRYCKSTTILTTNIDFKMLGKYLDDPVVTAAMVDRMVHHAVIINIDGPSWRMHESKRLNQRKQNPAKKTK